MISLDADPCPKLWLDVGRADRLVGGGHGLYDHSNASPYAQHRDHLTVVIGTVRGIIESIDESMMHRRWNPNRGGQ